MTTRRLTPFVMLEVSSVLSAISSGMTYIVIPWLILETTGSALLSGVVIAIKGIVSFVIYPIAGTLVDLVGRRRVAIVADAAVAVSAVLFVILSTSFGPNLAFLIGITLLGALFESPGFTARKALVANTALVGDVPLARANGLTESIRGIGWIAGPAAGSFSVALIGPINTFWVIGIGYLLSMVAVSCIRISHNVGGQSDLDDDRKGFLREAVDGFKALASDRPLAILVAFIVILDMVYIPAEEIVLPFYFNERQDPSSLGIVISSMVLGGTVGALLFEWMTKRFSIPAIIRFCVIGSCTLLLAISTFPPTWFFAITGFALGLVWGPINPLLSLLVQRRFPSAMQGRVFGVQLALWSVTPPIAMPFVGALVEQFGPQPVYFWLMFATFVMGLGIVFVPALAQLSQVREGGLGEELRKPRKVRNSS